MAPVEKALFLSPVSHSVSHPMSQWRALHHRRRHPLHLPCRPPIISQPAAPGVISYTSLARDPSFATGHAPLATARARHDATRGCPGPLRLLRTAVSPVEQLDTPPLLSLPLELATRSSVCFCGGRSTTALRPFPPSTAPGDPRKCSRSNVRSQRQRCLHAVTRASAVPMYHSSEKQISL